MPEDINEIPFYMDCVEKQYEIFEVPQDIRVHLMQPSDQPSDATNLVIERNVY